MVARSHRHRSGVDRSATTKGSPSTDDRDRTVATEAVNLRPEDCRRLIRSHLDRWGAVMQLAYHIGETPPPQKKAAVGLWAAATVAALGAEVQS